MRVLQGLLAAIFFVFLGVQSGVAKPALTGDQVERFIASFGDLRALVETQDVAAPDADDPMAAFMAAATGSGEMGKFEALARRHGFADMAEWMHVGSRTVQAFLAVNYESQVKDMQANMQAAREQIEADDSMTPDQKAMILKQMESLSQRPPAFTASAADQAVIAPYIEQLKALFGAE